ncbi:hypothetical protein [Paludisphaera soli]|uniref:hypothetical protein n=1 Tax=Paludisphaera soli TaxID=2712865 RepID=UPI0013EBAA38|nr:hypothetical protein [Paludisphaera soli]
MFRRILHASAPIAVALAVVGCGEDLGYQFPVHPASGQVSWKGSPVRGAMVRFHPVDPSALQPPKGEEALPLALATETEADGSFTMSTYFADDGVPAGEYVVTVTPLREGAAAADAGPDVDPTVPVEETEVHPDDLPPGTRRKAAPKPTFAKLYRDPAASPLRATVKPGGENRFTFELDAPEGKAARAVATRSSE